MKPRKYVNMQGVVVIWLKYRSIEIGQFNGYLFEDVTQSVLPKGIPIMASVT